ncbi:hypothetical protein SLH49_21650 [Cognatiyoonia sp. IB215446]|uniref:hypothetical protein n=1 Tax=Cognatiyoonia sp. IB215446 TaxID=3097355 RepID=UPI002A0CC8C9|nr:hypothetical protein [Cognatiyoonia sp. IB215446]MDX8350603.1 hypothetical protein [Cognatiyoonia sp. IB215446]
MDGLIVVFLVFDFVLALALVVVTMAQMDMRYAKQVREQEEYKSHFRHDRHKDR